MGESIISCVAPKYKKKNSLLFSRESECLQELIGLIAKQKHRTLVMWALDCAEVSLSSFEATYPNELRPRRALELCRVWAQGQIKMPEAKKAILEAHAPAKEIGDRVYAALCHAIGHAGATVHVETHALGLVLYELTAIIYDVGLESCNEAVSEKIRYYHDRLTYWQDKIDTVNTSWAKFLLDDTRPNKEQLLLEKRNSDKHGIS